MRTKVQAEAELGVGAPCGLYCDNCPPGQNGTGPGTCCTWEYCPSHLEGSTCEVYQCSVVSRGLSDCSECTDFPCTMLVRFNHNAQHPERLPAILNLQRRKDLGLNRWLVEERTFWQQMEKAEEWGVFQQALKEKRQYLDEMHARIRELTMDVELAGLSSVRESLPQGVQTRV